MNSFKSIFFEAIFYVCLDIKQKEKPRLEYRLSNIQIKITTQSAVYVAMNKGPE